MDQIVEHLPLLLPVFFLQLALMVVALVDLVRRQEVLGGNKLLWGVLIVVVGYIGPILYLVLGRKE